MPYIPESKNALSALITSVDEPYHEYWYHLGRFIHAFARTEAQQLSILRDVSGLTKARAGVLFTGTRSEEARDLINSFLEATGQQERKMRLSKPFAQFAAIGTVRNNVVHWGATTDFDLVFTVSNKDRSPIRPKEFYVSIEDFKNMYTDLTTIDAHFECDQRDNILNELNRSLLQIPWRYKPPQPSPHVNTKGRSRPKQQPPPRASQ
jgi:hypothetical protein